MFIIMYQAKNNPHFVFFGTSALSVHVLETLFKNGIAPVLIVTTPDTEKGRGLELQFSEAKAWAQSHNIPVISPTSLKTEEVKNELEKINANFFLVASYGKIIPRDIFNLPPKKTLNIHPSLLPKLRGATPIQTAILEEKETGVTIMVIDEEVDHGDIITQEKTDFPVWPLPYLEAEKVLAEAGANLLIKILPDWLSGKIESKAQDHTQATFTKKIEKKDGEISLNDSAEKNYRKFCAFTPWPSVYFFVKKDDKNIRVTIKDAVLENNTFIIKRVTPEGKKEMDYEAFQRGLRSTS